jgi:hypothetical protein
MPKVGLAAVGSSKLDSKAAYVWQHTDMKFLHCESGQ